MIRLIRDFRIVPIVLVAITALFVLKSLGLVFDGAYTLTDLVRNADDGDITGTVPQRSRIRRRRPASNRRRRLRCRSVRRRNPGRRKCSTFRT